MADIKLPSDKKSCSLYLSEENVDFLNLLALDQNCSQSKIASNLIDAEAKRTTEIIAQITTRLFANWQNSKQNFDQWLISATPWLSVKKIAPEHINKITKQLKALHDSRK